MKDPYTLVIQNRAQRVNNAVLEVVETQGKEESWKYKQACENVVYIIRKQNLETQQEATTLKTDQRAVNENYKAFIHEAYIVIDTCYKGKRADLMKMKAKKYIIS